MNNYLIQIAIGPIQDFIAAARRTRDLWAGSTMLSDIAKAAALAVSKNSGKLIFPNASQAELEKGSELSVANVILAEVEDADFNKLKAISDAAREAANKCFRGYADNAFRKMKDWVDKERWDAQIGDIMEFYSAWAVIRDKDYAGARKQVARLLAARKNIRDFNANPSPARVYKSALDGLRESVFKKDGRPSEEDVKHFPKDVRVKVNETLDAVGLIKRVPVSSDERFPSVSRVAMDAWLRGKGKDFIEQNIKALEFICDELVELGALSRVRDKAYKTFPYEGVVLMPSRHAAMMSELGSDFRRNKVEKLCSDIAGVINRLPSSERPPEPYLAFLVADGDKMGASLSKMTTAEEHREFSRELAKFAGEARNIIENNYGVCVYTGGDDVMAFLPLDKVLHCARELHENFYNLMHEFGDVSLSVGVSIAHAMEDLELQLDYGRRSESAAKKGADGKAAEHGEDRNGLAVSVRSRGNSEIIIREQWKAELDLKNINSLADVSLDQRLEWWAERFKENKIPNKFPYELKQNADFYKDWDNKDNLEKAVKDDVLRIFKRKDIDLLPEEKEQIKSYIERKINDAKGIKNLSDELITAQWIANYGLKQADNK